MRVCVLVCVPRLPGLLRSRAVRAAHCVGLRRCAALPAAADLQHEVDLSGARGFLQCINAGAAAAALLAGRCCCPAPAVCSRRAGALFTPAPAAPSARACLQWQFLEVQAPAPSGMGRVAGMTLADGKVHTDTNLVIAGNVLWQTEDRSLGVGESSCTPSNPTCNVEQLESDNHFNTLKPRLTANGRPAANSGLAGLSTLWRPLGSFPLPWAPGLNVPAGNLQMLIPRDRAGQRRTAARDAPGAWVVPAPASRAAARGSGVEEAP